MHGKTNKHRIPCPNKICPSSLVKRKSTENPLLSWDSQCMEEMSCLFFNNVYLMEYAFPEGHVTETFLHFYKFYKKSSAILVNTYFNMILIAADKQEAYIGFYRVFYLCFYVGFYVVLFFYTVPICLFRLCFPPSVFEVVH